MTIVRHNGAMRRISAGKPKSSKSKIPVALLTVPAFNNEVMGDLLFCYMKYLVNIYILRKSIVIRIEIGGVNLVMNIRPFETTSLKGT